MTLDLPGAAALITAVATGLGIGGGAVRWVFQHQEAKGSKQAKLNGDVLVSWNQFTDQLQEQMKEVKDDCRRQMHEQELRHEREATEIRQRLEREKRELEGRLEREKQKLETRVNEQGVELQELRGLLDSMINRPPTARTRQEDNPKDVPE